MIILGSNVCYNYILSYNIWICCSLPLPKLHVNIKKIENCIYHRQKTLSVTSTDPRNFLALGLRARKNLESASLTESSVFLPMKEIAILFFLDILQQFTTELQTSIYLLLSCPQLHEQEIPSVFWKLMTLMRAFPVSSARMSSVSLTGNARTNF